MCPLEDEFQREINFIGRLLVDVHEKSLEKYLARDGIWGKERMAKVVGKFRPFTSTQWLENRLPSAERPSGSLLQGEHLVFLDFVEKETALPILDMRWNLESGGGGMDFEITFRYFLLHWEDGNDKPSFVGFRLESPHGPGSHDYWHAQLITEFEKGDKAIERIIGGNFPSWIPKRQPALPLPARPGPEGMGDLLAIVMLSLYGLKELKRFSQLESFAALSERLASMGIIER